MTEILAPVPALHLPSAERTFAREGRVAFGSMAWEFWQKQQTGAVVWVVASSTDFPRAGLPGIDPGKIIFRGRFASMVQADRRHRHPDPALRPESTGSDGDWAVFFELDDLQRLDPPVPVLRAVTVQGQKLNHVPQGPIAIRDLEAAP